MLTVYGIETHHVRQFIHIFRQIVATVLTVYGIETSNGEQTTIWIAKEGCNSAYRLRY